MEATGRYWQAAKPPDHQVHTRAHHRTSRVDRNRSVGSDG
ncbi:hypothetical protein HMPREF9570_01501 [Cutibacterium acnes HL043PA1]|nr:hypothetical protein HMPREF9612_01176 [Cutibacterium acnes HL063PA2]EGE93873.1 hypothetical protein HMPREF9570_01501 [Cutibacterium acnes HL043PA1]